MRKLLTAIIFVLAVVALGFGMCNAPKVREINKQKLVNGPPCIPGKNCPNTPTLPPV